MYATFNERFQKQYKKAPLNIRSAWNERFYLFLKDPTHPFLHNHALHGSYEGKRSINITGDWRALYQQYSSNRIIFIALGTHSQLYK